MREVAHRMTDHVFSFFGDDGSEYHWNMTRVVEDLALKKLKPMMSGTAPLPDSLYHHVLTRNGVEEQHLKTVTPARMEEPIILIVFPDETHVVGDGNHRVVARWRSGKRDLPVQVISLQALEPYRLLTKGEAYASR